MSIFCALEVYQDHIPHSAAMNMAIDEVLLESADVPSIRFYRWDHPALSFGYFGRYAEVASHQSERDLVRRWTGGGIVMHGEDLTYSLIIPALDPLFATSPMSIYAAVHEAIRRALVASGKSAELAQDEAPKISDSCFANPVRADVLVNGSKVAGAAQRRSRAGLLQQGSIQHVDLTDNFGVRFARELSASCAARDLSSAVFDRARELAEAKYATKAWLHRR